MGTALRPCRLLILSVWSRSGRLHQGTVRVRCGTDAPCGLLPDQRCLFGGDRTHTLQLRRLMLCPLSYEEWRRITCGSSGRAPTSRHSRRTSGCTRDTRTSRPSFIGNRTQRNWDLNPGIRRSRAFEARALVRSAIPPCPGHSVHPVSSVHRASTLGFPSASGPACSPGCRIVLPVQDSRLLPLRVEGSGTLALSHLCVALVDETQTVRCVGWVLLPVDLCSTTQDRGVCSTSNRHCLRHRRRHPLFPYVRVV